MEKQLQIQYNSQKAVKLKLYMDIDNTMLEATEAPSTFNPR